MTVEYSLEELAEKAHLTARTVRYYIARKLLDGPVQGGRGARYGEAHLARLAEIAKLRQSGLSLFEIAARSKKGPVAPEGKAVWRYRVGAGVTVEVESGLAPWRMRRVQRLVAEMAVRLADEHEKEEREETE